MGDFYVASRRIATSSLVTYMSCNVSLVVPFRVLCWSVTRWWILEINSTSLAPLYCHQIYSRCFVVHCTRPVGGVFDKPASKQCEAIFIHMFMWHQIVEFNGQRRRCFGQVVWFRGCGRFVWILRVQKNMGITY